MSDHRLEHLRESILGFGADRVGFSVPDPKVTGYETLKYAITIGCRISASVVERIDQGATYEYFHHYRTLNAYLDQLSLRCARQVEDFGYRALSIAASQSVHIGKDEYTGLFQHKTAAVLSGLGFIGKSGLFIDAEYGAAIRLATVLTDLPVSSGNKAVKVRCGDCIRCRDACPAGAITGTEYDTGMPREELIFADKCSAYMKRAYMKIGRGSVCGICIAVCPFTRRYLDRKPR